MNDRHDPYAPQDPYAHDQHGQQGHAYDAYGQPVYHQDAPQQPPYDPYGQQAAYDPYGGQPTAGAYDPYGGQHGGAPGQDAHQDYAQQAGYPATGGQDAQTPPHDPYAQQGYGYDPYGGDQQGYQQTAYHQGQYGHEGYGQGGQAGQGSQEGYEQAGYGQQDAFSAPYDASYAQPGGLPDAMANAAPQQAPQQVSPLEAGPEAPPAAPPSEEERDPGNGLNAPREGKGRRRRRAAPPSSEAPSPDSPDASAAPDYRTEQFSFIKEPAEDSEDVIDWLKFTESRTERREEAKRRGRSRLVVLCVVVALLVVGGVGFLVFGGSDGDEDASGGAGQKRDVLVVHLRDTKSGNSATALLVDNESTHKGTTVLLPNNLVVAKEDGGTTTLGKSVKEEGTGPTREALNTLLGANMKATWRLDTPYLENLVETVGGITVDADTTVPAVKKDGPPAVEQGQGRELNGQAAVAYATYQAKGEPQTKQLTRFGQVMQATLKKVSSDPDGATATVKSLFQVLEAPLTEGQLGSSLAQRAKLVKEGAYATTLLAVQPDGTVGREAAQSVIKDVLGGTVKKADAGATPRVSVQNATGKKDAAGRAQAALINGGYTYVDGGGAPKERDTSEVTYGDAAQRARAEEVAKTLGLPAGAVKQDEGAPNADVTVVLGKDYRG
ncbi:LCP family protein [Streptomyces sp. NPDC003077]|uniref:LCP family protein n=1 Tax=Streptomyces sp. NPDC003077 TaxID=3154443 RepID=UPI0033A580E3